MQNEVKLEVKNLYKIFGSDPQQGMQLLRQGKSKKDIERHVDEWISKNKMKWDGWLAAARSAAM